MVNVVKGTFPVRFRIDGKDGTNTWLKYAETLDLTDTSSGKQYPSVMYDEPTSKCVYIGIGKGTGDEPTSGQYYQWTKYVGDDGTSFTPKGSAVAHYTSESEYNSATKSTGYYLVDASPSALLKYWNGSATVAKDSENGDGYTTSDKHLWVKDGEKWNDLGDIQGPKGDKTYLHTISVKSYSYNGTGCQNALIQIQTEEGKSNTYGCSGSRGLTVWSISKTSTSLTRYNCYDTYDSANWVANANKMARDIENGIVQDYNFLAITSYDACGFSANLIAALKKWGGSDIADYTPKRQAFSFLGYKGMPEGTAQQVLNIGEGKQAAIFALVNNGICQGKGQDGRSVVSITNEYQRSSDDKNAPSTWSESSPALDNFNKFLWRRQTIKYTYGSDDVDIQVVGKIGDKGIDGNGVDYAYCRTKTYTTPKKPSGTTPISSDTTVDSYVWTDDPKGVSSTYPYEWVSEMKQVNGVWQGYGTPTLWANYSKDGNSISGVSNKYLANSSSSTPSISGSKWYESPSETGFSADKKYLWNYETITYSQTTETTTTPRIIAVWGEKGNTGTSVSGVEEQYALSTSSSSVTGTWGANIPTLTATNKYLWNKERVLFDNGKTGNWSTPVIIGVYGDQGIKGDPAVTYKLNSSIVSIPLNNDGSPSKTSFTLTPKMSVGSTFGEFNSEYTIVVYISRSGSTTPVTVSYTLDKNTKNVSVYLTSNGGSTGTILKDITSVTCTLYHGQSSLDSFTILPVKAGAAGVSYFPNMCGVWDGANVTYKWTNGSRDMVTFYVGGTPYLFAVKTAGTTIKADVYNATPDKDSRWEKADSPFSMLFANFVYTDNASVAGFIWSADKMKSSSGLLEIDGKNGTIKCSRVELTGTINATGGTIGEFVIRDKGLGLACTADEADISMTCQSNTKRNARIYVTPKYDNAVISASTDTTIAAQFTASQSSGTALSVSGKTNINGAVNITGNITLSGTFSGLRLSATTMSSTGTIPLGSDIICFTNSSSITVTMPSPSEYKGRILFLKRTGSGGITLKGSFVGAGGTGTATSSEHVGSAKSMIYVSNGTYWIEFYCG